jgi:hypothetical protein
VKTRSIQFALASIALAVTATLLVTGMSVRSESRENPYDGLCRTAVWPRIPADCLEDGRRHNVRLVESAPQAAKVAAEVEAGDLANPPHLDARTGEDCCGMDNDFSFRGYTVELWDEAPTVSERDCPDQDDACLLAEADQISRVYHLQEALNVRASLWRAQHFDKSPVVAEAISAW